MDYLGELEPQAFAIEISIFDHKHTTIKPVQKENISETIIHIINNNKQKEVKRKQPHSLKEQNGIQH